MHQTRTISWSSSRNSSFLINLAVSILALIVIAKAEICYADYSGTVLNYDFTSSITQGESLLISLEVQNNGTERWTAYAQNFPYPKYLPSFKISISDMSWNQNMVYSYAQMYHVNAGETATFTKGLSEELPDDTGIYSFTIECEYHGAYSSDIYFPMSNSPIQVTFQIDPAQPPEADFTTIQRLGVAPFTVQFSDESTGVISSWHWDFGDGSVSSDENPSHTFSNPCDYNVTLTVTGPGGSDTLSKSGYIVAVKDGADINRDGQISLADVIFGMQVLTSIINDNDISFDNVPDVSGDGKLGIEEVIYVLQTLAGINRCEMP